MFVNCKEEEQQNVNIAAAEKSWFEKEICAQNGINQQNVWDARCYFPCLAESFRMVNNGMIIEEVLSKSNLLVLTAVLKGMIESFKKQAKTQRIPKSGRRFGDWLTMVWFLSILFLHLTLLGHSGYRQHMLGMMIFIHCARDDRYTPIKVFEEHHVCYFFLKVIHQ